jgi:hypothetical protein
MIGPFWESDNMDSRGSLGPGARAATGGMQSAWIHFFPVKNQVVQF